MGKARKKAGYANWGASDCSMVVDLGLSVKHGFWGTVDERQRVSGALQYGFCYVTLSYFLMSGFLV